MRIAIDTISGKNLIAKSILLNWLKHISQNSSELEFVLLETRATRAENLISIITAGPKNPLTNRLWQQFTLKPLLQKNNIDCILSPVQFGSKVCKKQVVVHSAIDVNFIHSQLKLDKNSSHILTTKDAVKSAQSRYANQKVNYLRPLPTHGLIPTAFMFQEDFRAEHTGGKDYFLVRIDNDDELFKNTLQAYTQFKKWQKSSLQLVIVIDAKEESAKIEVLRKTYKYTEDVTVLMGTQNFYDKDWLPWLGSSYAFIQHENSKQYPIQTIEALQCWIPVLSCNENELGGLFQNCVEWFEYGDAKSLSQKMILVYKDEINRQSLIQQGLKQIETFTASGVSLVYDLVQTIKVL